MVAAPLARGFSSEAFGVRSATAKLIIFQRFGIVGWTERPKADTQFFCIQPPEHKKR